MQKTNIGSWTRRSVIGAGLASIATTAFGQMASGENIAAAVRAITGGTPARLRILLPHGSKANLNPVIARFEALTRVVVDLVEVPVDEVAVQLTLDHMTQSATYDVALPATFSIPDLAENGVILPLSSLVDFDIATQTADGGLYKVGDTFDGQTYGFQTDGDAYVMFYNADFWTDAERAAYEDRHGIALDVPQTWAELDRQIAWFHRPDQGTWGGALFRSASYLAWEWWVRFHAKGTWPFSPDLVPQISGDAGVTALEEMIRVTQFLTPEARSAGLFENWDRFSAGDVYANIGWGGSQKYFNKPGSNIKGKLRYGPTPGGMIGEELHLTPYFNWGWNYTVVSGTSNAQLAMLFCAFATSSEASTQAVRQQDGFFDPFRAEHYADPGIQDAYTQAFLDVHRQSMEGAIPDLYLARQNEYFLALSTWLSRALDGAVPVEQALDNISQQWILISEDVGREKQALRWKELRQKYPLSSQRLMTDL